MTIFDSVGQTFVTDGTVQFDGPVSDSDDDGFEWNEATVVEIDAPPHTEAFDTSQFYKIDTVAAKSIEQSYTFFQDDDVVQVTLKKERDELQQGAWSLDNKALTLTHPDGRTVSSVDQVHGFIRNPRYEDNSLRVDTYVPINDEKAVEFIDEHDQVSVGFHTDIEVADGDTDVDGYQRNLYFDHLAVVPEGRCSREDGCGFSVNDAIVHSQGNQQSTTADNAADSVHDFTPSIRPMSPNTNTDGMMADTTCSVGPCSCGLHTDAPDGVYVEDGDWYGVAPSENPDGEPKYELNNCNDVKDAFNLRNNGDYDISTDTLVSRIKAAASAHDCSVERKPWVDSQTTMTDGNSSSDSGTDPMIDVADLSVDALADKHDGVNELLEQKESLADERDEYKNKVDVLEDERDELKQVIDEFEEGDRRPKAELVDEITDLTGAWDEDELMDTERDEVLQRLEVAKDAASETTAPSGAESSSSSDDESSEPKYKPGETYDLDAR